MDCQLAFLPDAGRPSTVLKAVATTMRREATLFLRRVRKVARHPALPLTRVRASLARARRGRCGPADFALVRLGLQPGERVRVRAWSEILATLDQRSRCQGLGWMPLMRDFCGTDQTVLRRVDRFFDERTRRMLTPRDVVLLEGVCCRPSPDGPWDYAGCDRTCLLFWKEAWLERLG